MFKLNIRYFGISENTRRFYFQWLSIKNKLTTQYKDYSTTLEIIYYHIVWYTGLFPTNRPT